MEQEEKVESSILIQSENEDENNEEETNNNDNEALNFLEDPSSEMTYGRRMALWLMKYKWYNPQQLPREQELVQKDEKEGEKDGEIAMKDESDELVEPLLERQNKTKEGKDDDEEKAERREIPSLEKAWAFFEHVTMPRYIYRPEDGEYPKSLDRAQPGESAQKTRLYSPLWTPIDQMGDFGIGIGLYFSALKSCIILLFIAGIFSIPNIIYYASDQYGSNAQEDVEGYLHGTAICTDTTWVPCPTCDSDDFKGAEYRLTEENGIQYALKNNCKSPPISLGITSWFTMLLIGIGFIIIKILQDNTLVRMDEDEQTATDYSIHIHNPPDDATDPDEWKNFLETNFGKVAVVTTCINNDELVRALVKRRDCLLQISRKLKRDDFTDEELEVLGEENRIENSQQWCLSRCFKRYVLYPIGLLDIAALQKKYEKLNIQIREIVLHSDFKNDNDSTTELQATSSSSTMSTNSLKPFPVDNVFVTFETEDAQRKCLHALSCGTIHAVLNNTYAFPNKDHLFRGEQILLVDEPEEPSTIRWQHLNISFFGRLKVLASTLFATFCGIVILAFIVKLLHDKSSVYSAYAIAAFNVIFPQFCMALTRIEPHKSAGDKQTSLFTKIALFRWVNTVMVIDFVTPFTSRISNSGVTGDHAALIPSVFAIFKADLIVMILLQLSDPIGMFNRHYKAPRAFDQEAMYRNFKGNNWRLAERYTNMSKVLFLSFYYYAIFPSALFLCAGTMLVIYYADSYSIMRIWKRNPQIGPQIAHFNDKYIVPFYILVLAILSSYWWSAFPFDNLCPVDSTDFPTQAPTDLDDNLFPPGYDALSDSDYKNGTFYEYCNQNEMFREFPVSEHNSWMTDDQEKMTKLFGWTSIGILVLMILFFMFMGFKLFLRLFISDYSPDGRDMDMPFSTLEDNCTYVPQVDSKETPYPFIVGNLKDMDPELHDWVSAEHDYDYYNVTLDLKDILSPEELEEVSTKTLFSTVKDYIGTAATSAIAPDVATTKDTPDVTSSDTPDVAKSADTPDAVATALVVAADKHNVVASTDVPDVVTSTNTLEDVKSTEEEVIDI